MQIDVAENNVGGERYYTAYPKPRLVARGGELYLETSWEELGSWCIEQFGETPIDGVWTTGARWYMNNSKFWFRNKEDLTWFILRWS